TTRAKRSGESEGNPYYFQSRAKFEESIAAGDFAEYSTNENGALYGVTHAELKRITETGKLRFGELIGKVLSQLKKATQKFLLYLFRHHLKFLKKDSVRVIKERMKLIFKSAWNIQGNGSNT
ncbi:MAG: hypothetical protein WAU88_15175, partial [Candidatus Zixiibacteriota bacterium]